jgi:hypothetical protein
VALRRPPLLLSRSDTQLLGRLLLLVVMLVVSTIVRVTIVELAPTGRTVVLGERRQPGGNVGGSWRSPARQARHSAA